jgi:transcriptional regulator with XRE-family HTH domain
MRSPAYRKFCERLRLARTSRGLTQAEAAQRLGWRQPMLSEMETGERRVDVIELTQLAKLYRKSLKWFVADP